MATISGGKPVPGVAWTSQKITGGQATQHLKRERARAAESRSEQRRTSKPVPKPKPKPKPKPRAKVQAKPKPVATGPTTIGRGKAVRDAVWKSTQKTASQVGQHLKRERARGVEQRSEQRRTITEIVPAAQPLRAVAPTAPIPRPLNPTPREEAAAWGAIKLKKGEMPKGPLPPEVMRLMGLS